MYVCLQIRLVFDQGIMCKMFKISTNLQILALNLSILCDSCMIL